MMTLTAPLLIWTGEIPTTWFQAFNPFMIFAFAPAMISPRASSKNAISHRGRAFRQVARAHRRPNPGPRLRAGG